MHSIWNILLHLRKIKCPLVKAYPFASCQYFHKSLVLQMNDASIRICNTFRSRAKQINFDIVPHCCSSQYLCALYKSLCTVAENRNDQLNKIICLFESKKLENEKLDIQGLFDSVCEIQELSVGEWDYLKEQLLKFSKIFNLVNFSGNVMKNLESRGNYFLARSFMQYLETKNEQPNLFTLSTFMKLCAKNIDKCEEMDILNMYHKVKHLKIMDAILTENVIRSLSATSQWENGYKIYKETENNVPKDAISSLAFAAFNYHNFEIAFELVKEIENFSSHDWKNVHIAWMNAISNVHEKFPQKSSLLWDKLLLHLHSKEIIISKEAAGLMFHYFECLKGEDWEATFVKLSRKKTCPSCNQQLQLLEISANEYVMLKEAVLEKIIRGSDVFLKTTPAELNRFTRFLNSTAPYDIVIDGLNIAYYYLHNAPNSQRAHQLYLVASHFAKKGMKIFVLGRNHMKKWPKTYMDALSQIAQVFYAENISQDDPFLLYAALMSGPHTMILTKDLLRNHKFWLEDPLLSSYFECWRRSHQVFLERVHQDSGSVVCEDPLPYSIVAQGSVEKGWHIPCKLSENSLKSVYDFHKDWLCIKRKS